MRASSTVAVLATSLVGLIGALLVEGERHTRRQPGVNGEVFLHGSTDAILYTLTHRDDPHLCYQGVQWGICLLSVSRPSLTDARARPLMLTHISLTDQLHL